MILAATSGAVNVRLGGEALKPVFADLALPEAPAWARNRHRHGQHARPRGRGPHLRSIVGLVWRSVVLWMVLLALLTLARLLG